MKSFREYINESKESVELAKLQKHFNKQLGDYIEFIDIVGSKETEGLYLHLRISKKNTSDILNYLENEESWNPKGKYMFSEGSLVMIELENEVKDSDIVIGLA